MPDKAIRISITGTETNENQAKPIQPAKALVRSHKRIIDTNTKIPDIIIRIKCSFPRSVTNSPPSSKGKKSVTSNPMNVLIRNRIGPTTDPFPSIPQSRPKEKINNNALPEMNSELNNHLLGAPTARRELTSSRMWL
jgi:hypothetical protein